DDPDGCGNVYVSGTYNHSLTIASANDIIIAPTTSTTSKQPLDWAGGDENLKKDGDFVLGLIANNFVRVAHLVNRTFNSRGQQTGCGNTYSVNDNKDLQIDAAILSLQHSFIVDNYDCGNKLGQLNVTGAIAQRYRGPVGTSGGTGFFKNYWY